MEVNLSTNPNNKDAVASQNNINANMNHTKFDIFVTPVMIYFENIENIRCDR